MTRFVVVPQWQGSPSSRAMTLIDGVDAIAGDLPRSATERIEVPVEAGDELGTGIRRFSALARTRDLVSAALENTDEAVLVIGGDCAVAVPAIAQAARRHPNVAVVWFDAHGDLNSPDTSPSHAFAGMALHAAFTDGPWGPASVTADRVILAGARDLDEPEARAIAETGVRALTVDDLADPSALAAAVADTGADAVYIHVDLDVLDPAVVTGVGLPVPFGLETATLTTAVAALRERMPLAGASLAGFAPATPDAAVDDLGTILRLVGALA